MINSRFGSLKVTALNPKKDNYRRFWDCLCDCGGTVTVREDSLKRSNTQSCGCLQKQRASEASTTHAASNTRLYKTWKGMHQRCGNPTNPDFHKYGGRGIKICTEWDSFEVFREWAESSGYTGSLTIDREDVDGDYTPGNCRWATRGTQARNKRKQPGKSSKFIGVTRVSDARWEAAVTHKGISHYLGSFDSETEAAQTRDLFVKQNQWDHNLNF